MSHRIPIITDTHFGARGDSQVIYANQEDFYTNIFWPAIDAEGGVTEILHLGEMTDRRKFVNFQTLSFAKHMFFEPARQRGIKVHWLLSNHDLPYKHSLSLSSHEAFKEYTNVQVYRTATEIRVQDTAVLLMPWLCDENTTHSMDTLAQYTGSVVMGHFEFGGFEMFRGVTNDHGLSTDAFKQFPLVLSGHYHHKSSRGNIHYLGSPYEMIWSDHGDAHGFHWWTPETHDLTFVENPHHLFFRFIYDDADQPMTYVKELLASMSSRGVAQRIVKVLVRKKTQPIWYETFADAVMKLGCHDVQFIDDSAWTPEDMPTEAANTSLDTLSTIRWYVQSLPWANSDIQRDVTALMTSLYQEAAEQAKTVARA